MNKSAQFFLVAALVIVGIMVGLATVYNATNTSREDLTVYDLAEEINYEGARVLESGTFNGIDNNQIEENIERLIEFYSETNQNHEFYGIYGDEEELTLIFYETSETGSVGVSVGGSPIDVEPVGQAKGKKADIKNNREKDKVLINIGEEEYSFDISQGKTLYVIVAVEKNSERHVASPSGSSGPHNSPEI
jgi:hypothetical protein